MKKSLLLLASLLVSVASFAQWTKPVPAATTDFKYSVKADSLRGDTTIYYLYNKEAGAFLTQGNAWGTQATIANRGLKWFVSKYIPTTTADDGTVTTGEWDGSSVIFTDYVETQKAWKDLVITTTDNNIDGGLYVDRGSQPDYFFSLESAGSDAFRIFCAASNPNANPTKVTYTAYIGVTSNAQEANGTYVNSDIDIAEDPTAWVTWQFVTEEAYAEYLPKIEQYEAAEALAEFIANAKENYPSISTAAAEAVYNNTSSTVEQLNDAKEALNTAIKNVEFGEATNDNPVDATKFLQNPSFDGNIDGWDCTFESGVNATNIGYQSASYTNGEVSINQFIEAWTPNAMNENIPDVNAIGVGQLSQTIKNMPQGKYKFTVDCIAVAQNVAANNPVKGVQLFATGGELDVFTTIATGNGSPEHFELTFVNDGGEIVLGLRTTEECVANWIAADNFTLTYYGPTDEDPEKINMDAIVEQALAAYPEEAFEDLVAAKDAKDAFTAAIEAAQSATEEYKAAAEAVTAAKKALDDSVDAYSSFAAKVNEIRDYLLEDEFAEGERGDYLSDYVMEGNEEEPAEGLPYGSADYILINNLPTTEQITEETARIAELFQVAIAESLYEGKDCTRMLANADFSDPNGAGWTKSGSNLTMTGGIIPDQTKLAAGETSKGVPVAESYHSYFDISQVLTNVPDGIYALSLNGFNRYDDGADASSSAAEIYLNDFTTPLMDLTADPLPKDEANDGYNCYLTPAATGPWSTNPIFEGGKQQSPSNSADSETENGYIPNGMEGASVAFSAGRYKATVYGLIEGGTATIGVRQNKSTTVWSLWGNFKLTYMGKNEEALQELLPTYVDKLTELYENNADLLTTPATTDIETVLAKAEEATDADAMYDALKEINAAISAAEANKTAVEAYNDEMSALEAILEEYSEGDISAFTEISDEVEAYSDLTTEGVNALVEKMKEAEKAIVFANATADSPADITNLYIVNPDFSTGNINGWTDTFTAGNHGYQSNATYGGVIDQFMEAWRSSAAASPTPLANGSISQEITLPAGSYILSADVIAKDQANNEEVTGMYLFAGDNRVAVNADSEAPGHYELAFVLEETTTLAIGLLVEDTNGNWLAADNFKLVTKGGDITAIEVVENNEAATVNAIYNAAGIRVSKLQKGINIVKVGKDVKKVYVK